jgi:hypothetical protein
MAGPVGSLIVRVGSDIRGLAQGLGKGADLVKRFGEENKKAAKRIALFATAAAAAGAAIAIKLTRDGLRSVDAMVKLGRTVGATQAEMVALNAAADDVGISQETMQKSIQGFTKRLGEAMEGTGTAGDALAKLGLKARDLASTPLPEALALVAERTQALGSAAERAAVESDLFGRAGIGMLTTTADLAGALKLAEKNTKDFGIAISQVDAAKIEAANDAMGRIALVFRGVGTQLAVELAPVLQEVAERITEAARQGRGFGDAIQAGVSSSIRFIGALINRFHDFQETLLFIDLTAADIERRRLALFGSPQELSAATRIVDEAAQRLAEFRELPPFDVDEFIRTVREKADAAAAAVEAVTSGMDVGEPLGRLEGGGEDPELEALREKAEARLEIIRQGLLSEKEAEAEAFQEKLATLQEGRDLELLGAQEFNAQKEALTQEHEDRLTDIEEAAAEERRRLAEAAARERIANIASQFDAIGSLTNSLNATVFKNNKAAAIAESVMLGIAGAIRTWNSYPYPWNILPTAAHVAGTAAQIAQITSSSFSGGKTKPSAPSAAVPTGQGGGGSGGGGAGGGGSGQAVNISLVGERFGRTQVRDLIEQINSAVADGARLRIV